MDYEQKKKKSLEKVWEMFANSKKVTTFCTRNRERNPR